MAPISTYVSFASLALIAATGVEGALHNTRSRQHANGLAGRRVGSVAAREEAAVDVTKKGMKKRCAKHASHSSSVVEATTSVEPTPTTTYKPDPTTSKAEPTTTYKPDPTTSSKEAPKPSATKSSSSSDNSGSDNSGSYNSGGDSSSYGSGSSSSSSYGGSSSSSSGESHDGLDWVDDISSFGFGGASSSMTGGVGSWFQADSYQDSTNGVSWCNIKYSNDMPLFAPNMKVMSPSLATWGSNPSQWEADATKYCGLEAEVTWNGKTKTLYIGDAFDPSWVLTPASIDILHTSWADLRGEDSWDKNNVMTGVSWKLTGYRNPTYAFHA